MSRHFQEQYIMYDEKTGQMIADYNWVADPVSAANADDVMHDAIRQIMKDRDLTENNSTVEHYQIINNNHCRISNLYYWHGMLEMAVREEIIVDEVIIWDDLDLDELDPKAREIYESWDQSNDAYIMGCNNIEELNETLLAYGE